MNDKVYQPTYRGLKKAHEFAKDNKLYSKAIGPVLGAMGVPGPIAAIASKGVEKLGGSKKPLAGGSKKKAPRRKNPYSSDAKSNVARPIPRMSGDGIRIVPRLEMNARRFMKGNEKLLKGSAAGPAGNPSTAAQVAGLNTAMTGGGFYKAGSIISV